MLSSSSLKLSRVVLALTVVAGVLALPAARAEAEPATIRIGYSPGDYASLLQAAAYLQDGVQTAAEQVDLPLFLNTAAAVHHFLLGIAGKLNNPDGGCADQVHRWVVLDPGPYHSEVRHPDSKSLDIVNEYYCLFYEETEKTNATLLTFLTGIDASKKRVARPVIPLPAVQPEKHQFSGDGFYVAANLPLDPTYVLMHVQTSVAGVFTAVGFDANVEAYFGTVDTGPYDGRSFRPPSPGVIPSLEVGINGPWALTFDIIDALGAPLAPGASAGSADPQVLRLGAVTALDYSFAGLTPDNVKFIAFLDGAGTLLTLAVDLDSPLSGSVPVPAGTAMAVVNVDGGGSWNVTLR